MAVPRSKDPLAYKRVTLIIDRRRPGSRYVIRWHDPMTRRIRQLGYPTQREQLAARDAKSAELNGWLHLHRAAPWHTVCAKYALSMAGREKKYQARSAHLLLMFWHVCQPADVSSIDRQSCEAFFAARLRGEPEGISRAVPSPGTRLLEYKVLRAFFAWCLDCGYLPRNPLVNVSRPKTEEIEVRPPKPEEWLRLLKVLSSDDLNVPDRQAWYILILLGVVTGLRQEALLRVEIFAGDRLCNKVELAGSDDNGIGLLIATSMKTRKRKYFGLPPAVNDKLAHRLSDLPARTRYLLPVNWIHRFPHEQ